MRLINNIWSLYDKRLSILKNSHKSKRAKQPKKRGYKPEILQEIQTTDKHQKMLNLINNKIWNKVRQLFVVWQVSEDQKTDNIQV